MRWLALFVALAACKTRVIDLGRPDASLDARLAACACRIPCPAATAAECMLLGSAAMCGIDHFCVGSLGACTATTPAPCGGSAAPSSVCRDVLTTSTCQE